MQQLQLEQMQQQQQKQQQEGHGDGRRASGGCAAATPSLPKLPPLPPLGLVEHRTSNSFNLHIKIADFGLSKRAVHSLPKTRVGTINYMAPGGCCMNAVETSEKLSGLGSELVPAVEALSMAAVQDAVCQQIA